MAEESTTPQQERAPVPFWSRAIVQIFLVGLLGFCCPGMFNALNGLGKAGGKDSSAGNAANAVLYGCFAVFGYLGGACFNLFGNKVLMVVGGSMYAVYAAGVYIANTVDGADFVAVIAGALLGFGAGWFWTSQGAMMMAYASPSRKGFYIGMFWMLFNWGGMMGGLLMMGLNWNTDVEQANPASYWTFVAIMSLGALGALLLAAPQNVVRDDGQPVVFQKAQSAKEEIVGAIMVVKNRTMLLLTLLFLTSNWFYAYQLTGFNGTLFNIRTRGLNSALYWGSQMIGSYGIGRLLDMRGTSTRRRGYCGLLTVFFFLNLAFILGAFVQYTWDGGLWDKSWNDDTGKWNDPFDGRKLDLTDSSRAAFPIIVFLLYGVGDAMLQTYAYWHMAAAAGQDTALAARFAGYYKGVQSLGACVSWVLDLYVKFEPQFWICWMLFLASTPLIYVSIRDFSDTLDDDDGAVPIGKQTSSEVCTVPATRPAMTEG